MASQALAGRRRQGSRHTSRRKRPVREVDDALKARLSRPPERCSLTASWTRGAWTGQSSRKGAERAVESRPAKPALLQASPVPEKSIAGGVVLAVGNGRALPDGRPLASYFFARSSRRLRVNGSAFSARSRARCAKLP